MPAKLDISNRTVQVSVPQAIAFDAKKMTKVTASVLRKLGCPGCHSGFDIRFIQELDFVVDPKTLDVAGRAGIR